MKLLGTLFTVFAAFILPIGAGVFLSVKKKGYLKPVLLGAATFTVFQILTRIPLLQIVGKTSWFTLFSMTQPVLYAIFLGGTAALFEEGGRWLVMRLFMKNKHRFNDGVAFGLGHGGIEAALLVGVNAILLLFNQSQAFTGGQLFAGGYERICTLIIHIAFSVMVLKSVALKKPQWLILAFALHTVIDFVAVMMMGAGASMFVMEAVVTVFALGLLAYILIECKKYKGAEFQ